MKAVLAEARKLAGGSDGPLPFSRVVIGGFSLGSITSLDVALQLDAGETVAGTKRRSNARLTRHVATAMLLPPADGTRLILRLVAGVLVMNGAPICVEEWAERIKLHPGLKVFISGGMNDMTSTPNEIEISPSRDRRIAPCHAHVYHATCMRRHALSRV